MKRIGLAVTLAVCCLGLAQTARAADTEPEINTDRPDFTDSSQVVPLGAFQLESGFTWSTGPDDVDLFDAPELLLRWGVLRHTELRLAPPQYFRFGGAAHGDGFGDTLLGMKQELGNWRGWDFGVIPSVSIPTGGRTFTSDGVDPQVELTWGRDVSKRWDLGGMFAFYWPTSGTEDDRRNFTWRTTLSLDYALSSRWHTFLEYANSLPERGGDQHLLHHGYTYALNNISQLDLHFGFGLSAASPDVFIGGGYSRRFK